MTSTGETRLRLSGIIAESIVDGPGYRMTVFAQGCPHRCPGCHNPETHDFSGGYDSDIMDIFQAFSKNPLLAGITFSGGEPFLWPGPLSLLAQMVRGMGKTVWTYTGYTFEQLLERSAGDAAVAALLQTTDVLVDGPFLLAQRSLMLKFRGSANQRILDVKKSLEMGCAREYNFCE